MKHYATDEILTRVQHFADKAHGEQMRKYTPQRYIIHPVEVMRLCRKHTDKITVLCAALLHDVLEDTPVKDAEILDFLRPLIDPADAQETLKLIIELTDIYTHHNYPMFNRRQRKERERQRLNRVSPDAQTIKYADIISNSIDIAQHDKDFGPKFLGEAKALLKEMNDGNADLYRQAIETVEQCVQMMKTRS